MTKEERINVSIQHWLDNAWKLARGQRLDYHEYQAATCPLCKVYRMPGCPDCPLTAIGEMCANSDSAWKTFANDQTLKNALGVVDALIRAKEEVEQDKAVDQPFFYIWEEGKKPAGKAGHAAIFS